MSDGKPRARLTARRRIAAATACWGLLSVLGLAGAARAELPQGIWALAGLEEGLPGDDLEPLRQIVRRAEVVGLGEAVHTTSGFSRAKARLFQFMVEELGFRAFGIESPWASADRVARYVESCKGSTAGALRGLFGVWQNASMERLVVWMCRWNRDHPDDPVFFYGFDHQQSRGDSFALRQFLRRIGFAEDDPRLEVIRGCDATVAPGRDALDACLELFDELLRRFDDEAERWIDKTSAEELEYARLHVVGLAAHQRQLFYSASGEFEIAFEVRDEAMAILAERIRRLRFPDAKTALWAHNGHISRGDFVRGARSMGQFLKRVFRGRYRTVALVAYEAEIDWPGVGCGLYRQAAEGSLEAVLRQLGEPYLLVDLAFRRVKEPFLEKGRRYDVNWGAELVPKRAFNGLVYMDLAAKMEPLAWSPCG